MKISFFETGRYQTPHPLPAEWPAAPANYDPASGDKAYQTMIERLEYIESIGFDWVSLSEHHYSPRILTPSPIVSAAYVAARVKKLKIALLGPIVPQSNPIRVAEELAMVDTLSQGRLVVGMLRGTTNEYLSFDLNPAEARAKTDEGMELILKAWTEPQPFGWQGRHFQYRTVSVWPRPLQQPMPPTYALGTSKESCDFAARNRLGLGVSYGPFEVMAKSTNYYRAQCKEYGWEPGPDQIIYRANMLLAETNAKADEQMQAQTGAAPFPMRPALREAMLQADKRNIAGEARQANVGGVLPTTFIGGPDRVINQIKECRQVVGAGVLDLSLTSPGSGDLDALMDSVALFGRTVLPHIKDI
jgi:alkanesulfonate monooxygenase SsuD/methylene tetrahydromethanopterin reductase-like flavin-dependent oxidoreductase (luciferase family)